jgi:zinc carboxypeptidase
MFTRKAAVKGCATAASVVVLLVASAAPQAQQKSTTPKLTTPKEHFGHDIGDDYYLANYTQYVEYLKKLDAQSDRMTVVEIGKTEEGRPELTAIITSPENHKRLAQIKETNRKLALAEGLTDDQARQLAKDGKTVVWIDGGLHATEVLGAQQLIETIYRLNSKTDPETLRILNDDVVLCTLVNPDGMELVSNWYMREADEKKRSTNGIPRLYQKYIGHDDNRDFYMAAMSESVNANKMMYREWFPAIMYNHHQTGPAGSVLFAPPFRDPFNYNFDPLVVLGIDTVGSAIHTRLAAEGKPGAVMRSATNYSTWFNGGIRTTSYFHNQIGILTESIGNPTPVEIPFVLDMRRSATKTSSSICTRWGRTPSTRPAATTGRSIPSASRPRVRRSKRKRRGQAEAARISARVRRSAAAAAVVADGAGRRWRSTTTSCTTRRCATRAASSCRRISRTSSPRRSSSTR